MNGTDRPWSIIIPERGTISEVVVHNGGSYGRRVIKLDPPLRVEPGDRVMLPLTPAAVTRTVIEETQRCPDCRRRMILVDTGLVVVAYPMQHDRKWWCACGHTELGPPRTDRDRALEWRERWEQANPDVPKE